MRQVNMVPRCLRVRVWLTCFLFVLYCWIFYDEFKNGERKAFYFLKRCNTTGMKQHLEIVPYVLPISQHCYGRDKRKLKGVK